MDDRHLDLLVKIIREAPQDPAELLRDMVSKMETSREKTALQMATLCLHAVRTGHLEIR